MMKIKSLIETNPYLQDPILRKKLIARSVDSSCAVEGIKISKQDSSSINIPNRIVRKCFACSKGKLHQKIKSQVYTYKGKSITLEQPGLWCDSCDEGILNGENIAKTEKTIDEFKAKVDGES